MKLLACSLSCLICASVIGDEDTFWTLREVSVVVQNNANRNLTQCLTGCIQNSCKSFGFSGARLCIYEPKTSSSSSARKVTLLSRVQAKPKVCTTKAHPNGIPKKIVIPRTTTMKTTKTTTKKPTTTKRISTTKRTTTTKKPTTMKKTTTTTTTTKRTTTRRTTKKTTTKKRMTTTTKVLPCGYTWKRLQNNCYKIFNRTNKFTGMRTFCREKNATIVTIHSLREQIFLAKMLYRQTCKVLSEYIDGTALIGLQFDGSKPRRSQKWVDGSAFDFDYFDENVQLTSSGITVMHAFPKRCEPQSQQEGHWYIETNTNAVFERVLCQKPIE